MLVDKILINRYRAVKKYKKVRQFEKMRNTLLIVEVIKKLTFK